MRSALSLFSVSLVLCGAGAARAADAVVGVETNPAWHHVAVSRLDQARPGPAAAAEAGPQKYLHIQMQIIDPAVLQNRDKFRIVDERGNEVEGSEVWGYNEGQKLLIFEGHWGSLVGLYLDGFGHREPLFEQVAAAPVVAAQPNYTVSPTVVRPTTYVAPRNDVYVAPRNDVVVHDDAYVVEPRRAVYDDTVVVDDRRDYVDQHRTVIVHDGYDHDSVVVEHRGHGGYGVGGGSGGGGGGGDGYGGGSGSGKA